MRRLSSWAPIAAVVTLPFLFHWRLFAGDPEERKIFRGDFLNQHYVWKSHALSRVAAGELPLWNPHVLGGVAIHANPQVGIFYPPTYLLLPFVDEGRVSYVALEAYQLLHQAFAALGMWLFMRSLGISNVGAAFAALVFAFTGFFTTPGHHAIVLTASWLPWTLLAVRWATRASGSRPIAGLALVLAATVLAGHPQVTYYAFVLAGLWAIAVSGFKKTATRFVPAAALALALSAIQLIPTYQLAEDSQRASLGYDYASSFAFSPYFLSATLVPRGQVRLPGDDDSGPLHVYAGVGTLLLACIGLTLSPHRWRLFFAATALVALFASFGRESPVFDWLYAALPGFDRFRVPYRLLGLYTTGMAVLAGAGAHVLETAGRKTRLRLRGIAKASVIALALLAAWTAYLHTGIAQPNGLTPAQVERVVGGAYWATLLAGLNIVLLAVVLWRPRERWAVPAMLIVGVIDLAAFVKDRGERPYRSLVRSDERAVHRLIHAQGDRSRYATESNLENYATLQGVDSVGGHDALVDARHAELLDLSHASANVLALLNVKFVARGAPPSNYPWCGSRFASPLPLLDVSPELAPARIAIVPPLTGSSLRLDWAPLGRAGEDSVVEILGVSHSLEPGRPLDVRFDEPTTIDRFTVRLDPESDGVRIEGIEIDLNPIGLRADWLVLDDIKINLHALPRAYFMVPSPVPGELQSLEALKCWNVHQGVQVQNPVTDEGASGFFRKDDARLMLYQPELVEVETRSPREGYLVLADTFRPGWIAEVDGVSSPLWRAQWSMRAVAVPAGEHRVRFRYQPRALRIGAIASGLSLAIVGALFAWPWMPRRRRPPEPAPPDEDFVAEASADDSSKARG